MRHFVPVKARIARPPLAWRDGNGNPVSLADYQGKVVLLNYWASWCIICQVELPSIDRLADKLAGLDFIAVALNVDTGGKAVAEAHARKLKLRNLPLNLDPGLLTTDVMGLTEMPTAYLFDRDGNLLGFPTGFARHFATNEGMSE